MKISKALFVVTVISLNAASFAEAAKVRSGGSSSSRSSSSSRTQSRPTQSHQQSQTQNKQQQQQQKRSAHYDDGELTTGETIGLVAMGALATHGAIELTKDVFSSGSSYEPSMNYNQPSAGYDTEPSTQDVGAQGTAARGSRPQQQQAESANYVQRAIVANLQRCSYETTNRWTYSGDKALLDMMLKNCSGPLSDLEAIDESFNYLATIVNSDVLLQADAAPPMESYARFKTGKIKSATLVKSKMQVILKESGF